MKLAVIVPSAEYLNNAGARIRYGRIAAPLLARGLTLDLVEIGEFAPETSDHDVVIISKCHDARALLIAARLAQRGKRVGVDLFDDYFSQCADSRMVRFRRWLAQLSPWLSFALCSTPAMAAVARRYRPDLPVAQINDPAPEGWDLDFDGRVARKMTEARDERILRICWFGIGDNPHFPVGLSDVAAFADQLAETGRRTDASVELAIVTNARALAANRLALIRSLPVPTTVEEWTEAAEAALLAKSFACFIPVNAQPFSAAKSLNRAVTALAAGCQVLSVGYPLYERFGELIYRDAEAFARDFVAGAMKLSELTAPKLRNEMAEIASASVEAGRFAEFLEAVEAPRAPEDRSFAVLHGVATSGDAHKMVQAMGGLSVATPYAPTKLGYDVVFVGGAGLELSMLVAQRQVARLTDHARKCLGPPTEIDGKRFALLPGEGSSGLLNDWKKAGLPFQLASYGSSVARMRDRLVDAFGPLNVIHSENSRLPFDTGSAGVAE